MAVINLIKISSVIQVAVAGNNAPVFYGQQPKVRWQAWDNGGGVDLTIEQSTGIQSDFYHIATTDVRFNGSAVTNLGMFVSTLIGFFGANGT